MPVVHNTSKPESALRKKSNLVCYHAAHESLAVGETLVGHIPSKENVVNLMTKALYGQKRSIWSVIFLMIFMMTISYQF